MYILVYKKSVIFTFEAKLRLLGQTSESPFSRKPQRATVILGIRSF